MGAVESAQAEFIALGEGLKRLAGEVFETRGHPAVLLDQATNRTVRVWGWWTNADPGLPCLLWCSDRGWFATVVGPEEAGAPGYELPYWSHRIKLLDLALANSIGPHPSLGVLELQLVLDRYPTSVREALLWGIVQLRGAHQRAGRGATPNRDDEPRPAAGKIDPELAAHSLVPTMFKKRTNRRSWLSRPGCGIDTWPTRAAMSGPAKRSTPQ